ncbi:MAG: hypothetical protein PHV99_01825 [Candidatus Pacebacteria bacterium]|nr:hypothetical protein [Candidatus Paceibacterota bacterium]
MDEILIEEKKYVSSKQAAKATGYAKDYIGQLCREGRVPARLVGRSWYVLESALHDHRFGSPKDEPAKEKKTADMKQSTWESPRYETIQAEELPILERGEAQEELVVSDSLTAERLQETWQAWFDRFDTAAIEAVTPEAPAPEPEETREPEEPQNEAVEEEITVPVHAIHHEPYQPAPREFLPNFLAEEQQFEVELPSAEEIEEREEEPVRRVGMVFGVAGFVVAILSMSLAALGSGYLDTYITSNEQVGLIAGVAVYDK